jgi:cobalt-zinc-cadmium efflux system membrane fusion protein
MHDGRNLPDAGARTSSSRPRMLGLLGLALGVILLAAGCGREQAGEKPPAKVENPVKEADLTTVVLTPQAEARLGIRTAVVAESNVGRTRTVGGEVVAPPGGSIAVSAPVAGSLSPPRGGLPRVGTRLKKGQVVFRLVPLLPADRDLRLEAEREAEAARTRLEAAASKAKRAEQLLRDGAGSVRQAEEARAELGVAEAAVEAAQSRMALVNRSPVDPAGAIAVESPIDGLLQAVHAGTGQTVAPGAVLFEVVKHDPVWIRVPLYVGDLGSIEVREGARIVGLGEVAGAAGLEAAYVTAPPSADPNAASADVFFEMPNSEGAFRPGEKVGVRLKLRGGERRLVVPSSALLYDIHGGTWVYERSAPHAFVRRRVEVGDVVDSLVVLRRGPRVGAKVVTVGAAELFGTEFGAGK